MIGVARGGDVLGAPIARLGALAVSSRARRRGGPFAASCERRRAATFLGTTIAREASMLVRAKLARRTGRILTLGSILVPSVVVGCNAIVGLRDIDGTTSPDAHVDGAAGNEAGEGPDADIGLGAAEAGPGDAAVDGPADADAGCPVIPGLVGWWRGEDDVKDEVSGSDGAWIGGTATYVSGKSGKAFSLNAAGGGGFVSVPNSATLTLAIPFSISVWVNVSGDNLRAVDKLTNGTGDGYLLDLNDFRQPRLIAGLGSIEAPGGVIQANTWHHVVAVAESTSARRLYVDGVKVVELTVTSAGPQTPNVPLRFGADSDGTNRFSGLVDEVALFNRALTAGEVTSIHARGADSLCR